MDPLALRGEIGRLDDEKLHWITMGCIKELRERLTENNTHRAVVSLDLALAHLRLAEYAMEGAGQ